MSAVSCTPLFVDGAFIIEFPQYQDNRGFFEELYNMIKYPAEVPVTTIQQLSCSYSKANVFRGLHRSPYYKLVTCVSGEGYDIIADLREDSPTYLKWVRVWLSQTNHRQVFVPAGCGHGFYSMRDNSILVYAQGGTFIAENDRVVSWKDPVLNIQFLIGSEIVISDKDSEAGSLGIPQSVCQPRRTRLLVIGASGKMGSAISSYVNSHCDDIVIYGTHFDHRRGPTMHFDLENAARDVTAAEQLLDICCPHVVVICGSWTNVGYCDMEPEKSAAVMTTGPENIARAGKRRGIKTVAISSDYIFSGDRDPAQGPYTEDDPPSSISTYGRNKAQMEEKILQATDGTALILRTSTVNGKDNLKAGAFYMLYDRLVSGKEYFVPDVIRSPTYVKDLAKLTIKLIKLNVEGIVHTCGEQVGSLADYFRSVASSMGLDMNLVKLRERNRYQPIYSAMSSRKRKELVPDFRSLSITEAVHDWLKDEAEYCEEIRSKYPTS